jgi:VCBS repeat-containing protein
MFVASHSASGDQAIAAVLPPIIGNIHAAIGCGTLTRASGVAVQVMVGDPVCQGDVIETAADGQIAISLIDGTQFVLSHDTRVVLDGLVDDPDGVSQSALFAVDVGSFAFVAGGLAPTGSLRIDTPVGSIRGRARTGGFGMLSLTALTFATMSDAKAADPDATFLDDDNIAYKDLEHGTFELWTKEAVPRHIIVEDPGETVVLTKRGSSVNVSQLANSATRMEELQAAQQAVLANYAKGYGPSGSSTPNNLDLQKPQPINFVLPGGVTAPGLLPPLPEGPHPVVVEPFIPPPPPPTPPTLDTGAGPTEIDTVVFDTFTAANGTFSASSSNGAMLTFGISGGAAGNTVMNGVTYNISSTGAYGTLYLNSTTGAYTFVPNSAAINALKANTTQSFTITVSDGSLSVSQAFTIAITGADDAAIISGVATGSVVAPGGVTFATPGLLIATGTLTDTDVDDPPNTFTAISSPTPSTARYGTFVMTAAGAWTYTLDKTNNAVLALNVGGTLTDSFTVTTIGGTPQLVTITIHGPLIAATGTGPSLTLSETHLTATALDDNNAGSAPDATLTAISGNFATAFTSVQGGGTTISYTLSITGGNGTASGLIDSHTGQAVVLVLNGDTVEGRVGTTGGKLAFTITVDPATGIVTFAEYRAVAQPFGTKPDGGEGVSLTFGIVNLTATITDQNGGFQTVRIDLGSRLTITDDGPTIAATGTAPSLTLSETHLTATALDDNIAGSAPEATLTTTSANFSTAFTSVQGADGATISYALSITGGNGTASGLIDAHTGQADVLVLNGNTIEGHVGTMDGALAFTITLDPTTGLVTFSDYRAVMQPFGTNPDGAEGVSLTAGIVSLIATIRDKDGDFQTASIDLAKQLTITDDGPTIGGFQHAVVTAQDNQIVNGTYNVNFGADGAAAMLVTVHNGAVGSTGYNLATTNLGGGITSVHVTGNGDDYTFYYATHAVNGGVQLDAYFTYESGTLANPYFTLLINPDGTYSFDLKSVEVLKQVTVTGSTFGASGGGTPTLTAPDGELVITGSDNNAHPVDVKASNNGIAVGDSGLQMDPNEDLHLSFLHEQSQISFDLTQWQGNGTANVVVKVLDGNNDVHDFSINIPKPSGGTTNIVVKETSDAALINTYAFDSTTLTYTLYVGQTFNQVQLDYVQAVTGNATFTVNNITYNVASIIPSTDLLFDVSAVDVDGDSATSSLQVDLQGTATLATSLTLSTLANDVLVDATTGTKDAAVISGSTSGSVIEVSGATSGVPVATYTLDSVDEDNPDSSLTKSDKGYGTYTMTAAGVWTYTLDDAFVHLAVAKSNLTQFDTSADFASGSDKIDLAALGALAFLHLTSTSTSVPPHTIAWIYNSASSETIVYVNPTDGPLNIGDSALLEIHLQGVVSVQESDFIYQAATNAVAGTEAIDLALETIATADGAVLAADSTEMPAHSTDEPSARATWGWDPQAADEGFKFHFERDVETIGSVRLARFGDAPAYATVEFDSEAVIALTSTPSVELWNHYTGTPTENHFTFHKGPIYAGAIAIDETAAMSPVSTIEPPGFTAANAAAMSQLVEHGLTPGAGASSHQPQQELHTASQQTGANIPHAMANAVAASQLAEHGVTPGTGASHIAPQHEPHTTSQQAGSDDSHAPSPPPMAGGPSHHPAPASGSQASTVHDSEPPSSFLFKNEIAASKHAEPVALVEIGPATAPDTHGYGVGHSEQAAIPEIATAALSSAEEHAANHANVHIVSHGQHELLL